MHFFDAPTRRFSVTLISPNSFNSQARRNTSVNVGAVCKFRNDIHAHVHPVRSLKCCARLHVFVNKTDTRWPRTVRSVIFFSLENPIGRDWRSRLRRGTEASTFHVILLNGVNHTCYIGLICIYVWHVIGLSLPLNRERNLTCARTHYGHYVIYYGRTAESR